MDNEVVLILAARGGFTDLESVAHFRKLATGIDSGLSWLDADVGEGELDDADVALVCMWQHLGHYGIAKDLDRHTRGALRRYAVDREHDTDRVARRGRGRRLEARLTKRERRRPRRDAGVHGAIARAISSGTS
jgi:hypothetical protein